MKYDLFQSTAVLVHYVLFSQMSGQSSLVQFSAATDTLVKRKPCFVSDQGPIILYITNWSWGSTFYRVDLYLERDPRVLLHINSQIAN